VQIPHGAATVSEESASTMTGESVDRSMIDSPAVTARVELPRRGKTRMPAMIRESGYLVTGPSFTRR